MAVNKTCRGKRCGGRILTASLTLRIGSAFFIYLKAYPCGKCGLLHDPFGEVLPEKLVIKNGKVSASRR